MDQAQRIPVGILSLIEKQYGGNALLELVDQVRLKNLEVGIVGSDVFYIERVHDDFQQGICSAAIGGNDVGDIVSLVRTEPLVESADDRGFPRANGSVHVDWSNSVPRHVFTLRDCFLDLRGVEEISGIRPDAERLLGK